MDPGPQARRLIAPPVQSAHSCNPHSTPFIHRTNHYRPRGNLGRPPRLFPCGVGVQTELLRSRPASFTLHTNEQTPKRCGVCVFPLRVCFADQKQIFWCCSRQIVPQTHKFACSINMKHKQQALTQGICDAAAIYSR